MSYTRDYQKIARENSEELGLEPAVVSLELVLKILDEIGRRTIRWDIEDFKHRAIELYEMENDLEEYDGTDGKWKEMYDENKFEGALEEMISDHDCNNGITWDTIDYYLDEYCKK